jgi:cyanate lyase
MRHPVLRHFRGKPALAPPVVVLRPAVSQHLLRRLVFPHCHPVGLHHAFRRRAPIEPKIDHVARVVVQERHRVGILPAQPEREDVRLPHLVRCRPLKVARTHQVATRLGPPAHQIRLVQRLSNRLRARLQEEPPAQPLCYSLHPIPRVSPLHLDDLLHNRLGQSSPRPGRRLPPKPHLAFLAEGPHPQSQRARAYTCLHAHKLRLEPLLQVQLHRSQLLIEAVPIVPRPSLGPPSYRLLDCFLLVHDDTPCFIGVSPNFRVIACLRSGS